MDKTTSKYISSITYNSSGALFAKKKHEKKDWKRIHCAIQYTFQCFWVDLSKNIKHTSKNVYSEKCLIGNSYNFAYFNGISQNIICTIRWTSHVCNSMYVNEIERLQPKTHSLCTYGVKQRENSIMLLTTFNLGGRIQLIKQSR